MKKYDAVIAGYTCVDLIPDFKKTGAIDNIADLLKPGKLIEIDGLNFIIGGVVANAGLAMSKFGKKVFLNGLVGDDFIGRIAIEWLEKYHISEGITTISGQSTAFSIVLAPQGIDRIFLESLGCNQIFDNSLINFDAISQSRILHFGYPPLLKQYFQNNGSQLSELFSEVHRMGVVTSLDFSLPDPATESSKVNWPEIMKSVLPFTDIFAPSLEESLQIIFPTKYTELKLSSENSDIIDNISIDLIRILGKHITDSGVKILLIKMAHRGVYLLTGDTSSINGRGSLNLPDSWNFRELWCPAYPAVESRFINTTGAGDTTVAAFLSAILDGNCPETAIKYAAMAGRNNLYCNNIYEDLDEWPEMKKEIELYNHEIISFDGQLSKILDKNFVKKKVITKQI